MKEIKSDYLKVRVTSAEKERIMQYCKDKDLTFSDFMRMLWTKAIALDDTKKERGN